MPDRRTEILDTALRVLAEHGMRGLTHRAVDQAAALPMGSTSYYFRTRDALVGGCLQRLLELDQLDVKLDARPDGEAPWLETLVDQATETCLRMVTTGAHRTKARYELALHATRSAPLREAMVAAGTQLRELIATLLAGVGVAEPRLAADELAAVMDGLVFTALVRGPRRPAQLRRWLRPALHRALSAHLQSMPRKASQ